MEDGLMEPLSRGLLAARGFDTNHNGRVDELQMSGNVRERIAAGGADLSVEQLASALDNDQVIVKNGKVQISTGQSPVVIGRDALESIHDQTSTALSHARGYTWDAHILYASPQNPEEYQSAKNEYRRATYQFRGAAMALRSTLESVRSQAGRENNSLSNAVRSQADTALRYDFFNRFDGWYNAFNDGYDSQSGYDKAKSNYYEARREYENLESAVSSIQRTTSDLPDPAGQLVRLNRGVANAAGTLTDLGQAQRTMTVAQVQDKLQRQAGGELAQVKGRAKPYGGYGALIGAVAGGVIGGIAGKNGKTAAIGAGVGLAVAGGVGALIGHSIDSGHKKKAANLSSLSQEVASYDREADVRQLSDVAARGVLVEADARQTLQLDDARNVAGQAAATAGEAEGIQSRAARILGAYR
jgi:uncharacterized protein YcfJ